MIEQNPTRLPQALFGVLAQSLSFYVRFAFTITGLALLSSTGRAVQLGWSEYISGAQHLLLELMVEGARAAIFLVVVGEGSLTDGITAIKNAWKMTGFISIWNNLKYRWGAVLWSIAAFIVFASLINLVISLIAHNDIVLSAVRNFGFPPAKDDSLKVALIFFLKNITIIPFTLVWLRGMYRLLK